MADDTSTLRVVIDATGAEQGAQVYVRSVDSITAASTRVTGAQGNVAASLAASGQAASLADSQWAGLIAALEAQAAAAQGAVSASVLARAEINAYTQSATMAAKAAAELAAAQEAQAAEAAIVASEQQQVTAALEAYHAAQAAAAAGGQSPTNFAAGLSEETATIGQLSVAQTALNRLRGLSRDEMLAEVSAINTLPPAIRDEELALVNLAGQLQRSQGAASNLATVIAPQELESAAAAYSNLDGKIALIAPALAGGTAATVEAEGGMSKLEKALGAGTDGAGRLRYSLISLLDAEVGMTGATGRVVSGLGGLAIGALPIIGVLAGVAAISAVYHALTDDATKAQEATDKLVAAQVREANQASGKTDFDNIKALTKNLQDAQATLASDTHPGLALSANTAIMVGLNGQAAAAANVAKYLAEDQKGYDDARKALTNYVTVLGFKNDTDAQAMSVLRDEAAAAHLTGTEMTTLSSVIASYTDRMGKAQKGSEAWHVASTGLRDAEDLLSQQLAKGTQAANEHAKGMATLADSTGKATAEALRMSGDVIGAIEKERDARLALIAADDNAAGIKDHLTATQIAANIAADQSVVKSKASADIQTILAQKSAETASAYAKLHDAAMAVQIASEQQVNGAAAFNDSYAQRTAKIQADTAATLASIGARTNLTATEKLVYDAVTQATGALQLRAAALDHAAQLTQASADANTALSTAEGTYQVAVLKASGQTAQAQALEISNQEALYELTIRQQQAHSILSTAEAQANADELIALSRKTAALNEYAALNSTSVKAQSKEWQQLGNDIERSLATSFDNIFQKGISSFGDLFSDVEKLFEKLIADMAAHAIASNLASEFKSIFGSATSAGGALPGQTQANGLPLAAGSGSQALAGSSSAVPYAAIAIGVAGIVSSLISSADALQAARQQYQDNVLIFNTSLTQFVNNIGIAADSLQGKANSAFTQIGQEAINALQLAASNPDIQSIQGGFYSRILSTDAVNAIKSLGDVGLHDLITNYTALDATLTGPAHDALATLIDQLSALVPAADEAAKALVKTFTDTVQSEYNASLGTTGNELNTLAGYGTQRDKDIADARTADTTTPGTFAQLDPTILQTYSNNVQQFLESLSTSDLENLIPSLTGATLTYAQAIDASKRADDAATQSALDATAAAQKLTDQQNFLINSYQLQASVATDPEQAKYLNLAALKIQQDQERASAEALVTSGTITIGMFNDFSTALDTTFANAINSTTGTIVSAAQILSDNASALNAQFDVFQTSAADQLTQLGQLYGFTGKSDADLQAMYTKVTAGQELTDSQIALNKDIQQYLDLERQNNAASTSSASAVGASGTTTTAGPAAAATAYGSSTPIIAPNGTVNLTVNVSVSGADAADPTAIAEASVKIWDAALQRRATLVAGANGL